MSIEVSYNQQHYEPMNDEDLSDADITNQSSLIQDLSHHADHSVTESSDEQDTEEPAPIVKQEIPSTPHTAAYQQNCLAAAQMMQLLYANSVSSSTSTTSNHEQQQQVSPNTENEKENIPVCKYCNKVFANFSNLNHHVSAIHLNQSKWVCSQCGKICSSKSNLKVHLRVHLRVKPYHCRWCSYSCMHHSSIRDHLAKLHPDQTHTPLQPGYLFNSQAVPEPEVFNAVGFNASNFVTDSNLKRSYSPNREQESPEKPKYKKARVSNEKANKQISPDARSQQQKPVKKYTPSSSPPLNQMYNQIQAVRATLASQGNNLTNTANISNLYNAYNMARMLPFMYNPMQQMQYQNGAQQQQASPPSYMGMLNQNIIQLQSTIKSETSAFNSQQMQYQNGAQQQQQQASPPSYMGMLNQNIMQFQSTNKSETSAFNNQSLSSDDHTNSSTSISYSNSSRSSSLSPENKTEKQLSNDDSLSYPVKMEKYQVSPIREYVKPAVKKSILSVDEMLGTSSKKMTREMETQTESSCLKCSHCNHDC